MYVLLKKREREIESERELQNNYFKFYGDVKRNEQFKNTEIISDWKGSF